MRVLHVIPSIGVNSGGVRRSVPGLCDALYDVGLDVVLYTFKGSRTSATMSPDERSFPLREFPPLAGSRELPTLTFYRELRREVEQFDLVHLHSLWNAVITLSAVVCRQAGVPYVVSPRGMLHDRAIDRRRWRKMAYYWMLEQHTLAEAAAFHFLTDGELQHSRSLLPHKALSVVVPNGIDPSLVSAVKGGRFRQRHPELDGKRIMLFLGRLHPIKGLDLQIHALALLVREFPNLVWALVGPDEGEWPRLSRELRALGLERHVLWTGPVPPDRCLEALADADVFALTSHEEAHSMAMNEALAVGVPVVVTDTVQFNLIREAGAGHVVPRDPSHLAAGIADILRHPEQARMMREAGRQLVAERLAWPKVVERMVSAYEEVLRAAGGRRSAALHGYFP